MSILKKTGVVVVCFIAHLCFSTNGIAQEKADNSKKQIIPMDAVSILDIDVMEVEKKSIKIKYETPVNQNLQAIVYNMKGQEIHKIEYNVASGKSEKKHELPGLEAGNYFISFYYGSQNKTYKFSVE